MVLPRLSRSVKIAELRYMYKAFETTAVPFTDQIPEGFFFSPGAWRNYDSKTIQEMFSCYDPFCFAFASNVIRLLFT